MTVTTASGQRTGGHVVVETLAALGANVAFGVPGVHALAMWEALRTSGDVKPIVTRTELCAGFAADGYARSSRRAAPLLLSTGPGALNSLTAMMEAASSHVPVVAISSQIPRELLGTASRLPAQARRPARLVRPDRQARRSGRERGGDSRAAGSGVRSRDGAAERARVPGDPRRRAPRGGRKRPGREDPHRASDGPAGPTGPNRRGGPAAGGGRATRPVGRRRRAPVGRSGGAARAGRASRRAGRHHLHGQGRDRRVASARGRIRVRRGRSARAAGGRRRGAVRRHGARRRHDRPVRAALRRPR